MPDPTYYRRHLPHRQPTDGVFNIVVRLDGSLPKEVIEALKDAHAIPLKELEHENLDPAEREAAIRAEKSLYFGKFDDLLDNNTSGPHWLKDHRVAAIVRDSFLYWHGEGRYKLIAITIMSNHSGSRFVKTVNVIFNFCNRKETNLSPPNFSPGKS